MDQIPSQLDYYGIKKAELGIGTYGQVDLYQKDNNYYAIKKSNILNNSLEHPEIREIVLLTSIKKHMKHPNIICIHDAFFENDAFYLVMPYFGYRLTKYIKSKNRTRSINKEIIYQILSGLAYLHSFGIIHRDLTPSNILIVNNMIKIIDFGLAKRTDSTKEIFKNTLGMCSLWYRAPEIIFGNNYYDNKVDIWSVGCILAELLTGIGLFEVNDEDELATKILLLFGSFDNTIFSNKIKPEKVVKYMNDSPEYDQYLHYKFYTDLNDINDDNNNCYQWLKKLLSLNPMTRISAKDAMEDMFVETVRNIKYEKIFTLEEQIQIRLPQFYTLSLYQNIESYAPLRRDCLMTILEICIDQNMLNNTYFLTVTVFDKYLIDYWDILDWGLIDLMALSFLSIMSKFHHTEYLNLQNALKFYIKQYSDLEVYHMEQKILQDLNFDLDYSTVYDLLVYHNINFQKSLKRAAHMVTTDLLFRHGLTEFVILAINESNMRQINTTKK